MCIGVYVYMCVYTRISKHLYGEQSLSMYACVYVCVWLYLCMYVCMCMCVYICVCIGVHVYIHRRFIRQRVHEPTRRGNSSRGGG